MKRRDFLTAASSMVLPVLVDGFGVKSMAKNSVLIQALLNTSAAYNDRVLVVIYLEGGNDGLNTVIPLDQYSEYTGLRSNIAIPENKVLTLENSYGVGLHPAMGGMKNMYNDGKLCIVNSVAYPNPNKSHNRSTDIYMTAVESNQYSETGWAGRYLKERYPEYPDNFPNSQMEDPLAIEIGSLASISTFGNRQSMAVSIQAPDAFYDMIGNQDVGYKGSIPCCESGDMIKFVRQQQSLAVSYSNRIKKAADSGKNLATYPANGTISDLSEKLKIVARLISGGLTSKIYFVSLGGFDTHAAQVTNSDNTVGVHANLLKKMSDGISSFQADLKLQGNEDKVIGMTFSDFGRRASSNGSKGTDHGVAAPMFVFGTGIKKQIIGTSPNLTEGLLPPKSTVGSASYDIKMQVDFRRVYSDVLNGWFGVPKATTDTILFKSFSTTSIFSDFVESTKSGLWNNPENWSTGRVPDRTAYVKIAKGHTISLNQHVSVKNIQIDGEVSFNDAYDFTISG